MRKGVTRLDSNNRFDTFCQLEVEIHENDDESKRIQATVLIDCYSEVLDNIGYEISVYARKVIIKIILNGYHIIEDTRLGVSSISVGTFEKVRVEDEDSFGDLESTEIEFQAGVNLLGADAKARMSHKSEAKTGSISKKSREFTQVVGDSGMKIVPKPGDRWEISSADGGYIDSARARENLCEIERVRGANFDRIELRIELLPKNIEFKGLKEIPVLKNLNKEKILKVLAGKSMKDKLNHNDFIVISSAVMEGVDGY